MKQHFLQSEAWEKFQHELGNQTIRRRGDGWEYLAIVEHGGGLTRLYCPYGPTVTSIEALDLALEDLKQQARQRNAAFVRVQPTGVMLEATMTNARRMRAISYSQPVATRILDLSPSLDELFAGISQSKRSICRNYKTKGLTYRLSHDPTEVELLLPLLHDIAERNRIAVHSDGYIRKQASALMPEAASLHFIELDGQAISGALVFEDAETNYYAHAGTAAAHYKLQANTALVGELIAYSKNSGKRMLDLYGIAPNDDPHHLWAGVSAFKASFGGTVVTYNSTYDLPVQSVRYALYTTLRSLIRRR